MPGYCAFPVSKTKLVASQQTVHACGQPATRIIFRGMEGRLAPCLAAVTRQKRGCTACSCFFYSAAAMCAASSASWRISPPFVPVPCLIRCHLSRCISYPASRRGLPDHESRAASTTLGLSLLIVRRGCMRDGECRMMMLRFHRVHCEVHDPLASIRLTLAPATLLWPRSSAPHAS
jgi:hypothetical protein